MAKYAPQVARRQPRLRLVRITNDRLRNPPTAISLCSSICHLSFVIRSELQASSATFHACNVRARVMKTQIANSSGADLNNELEKADFSMGSGNWGSGSHSQRHRSL